MPTTTDEARTHVTEKLGIARARSARLADGPLRAALSDAFFAGIEERLDGDVSGWSTWPPLFCFAADHRGEHLADLDAALQAVRAHTRVERRPDVDRWLLADESDAGTRSWRGGLFELAMKTRFLTAATDVHFDVVLPNGRDVDIRATVAGRTMWFDATVITESDEDQGVFARFMEAKADDENAVLIRPGQHDPENPKGPSPYYDCARVYLKVFDKLAKNWNLAKHQMSDTDPNVLLLSIWTGHGMPYTSSPGIGWALDEVLADQPNSGANKELTRVGITDVSLATFLRNEAPAAALELLQSPRRLGAIALFDETRYGTSRANYNAHDANRLSHAEMAAVEPIACLPLTWA